jgi:hypothetical protein
VASGTLIYDRDTENTERKSARRLPQFALNVRLSVLSVLSVSEVKIAPFQARSIAA